MEFTRVMRRFFILLAALLPLMGALGAVPANFQRLVVAERPENGVLDLFGVSGFEDVGHSSSRATNDTIKNKVKRITPPLGRL